MDTFSKMIYISITVLIHYQILQLCLIGFILYRAIKRGIQHIWVSVLSFFISMVIIIGIPVGIVKITYPDQTKGSETTIIEEVTSWSR